MKRSLSCAGLVLALFALVALRPAIAERAIVDPHTLDAYFSLFAADSNVPWKPTTIRLQTYTGTPVDFSAYAVDAADVVTAGASARTLDTRHLHPVAQWQFTPQGGYQFQSSDVDVPLGTREGFFVIEARRGAVAEQVWIDRTRFGLVSKSAPGGLLLYVTDLGTGRALSNARVQFVVGSSFVTRYSDVHGIVRWTGSQRPVFALAQWGPSQAFLSFLPQAPLPNTIVGVRTDSAVVHAGDALHVIGYARTRTSTGLRASSGNAEIAVRAGATAIEQKSVRLDAAGAFALSIDLPLDAKAGDYTVLAQVDGATGGAVVRVDGDAAGLALSAVAECGQSCDPNADVPLVVHAVRHGHGVGGVKVHVDVVRSPHAYDDDDANAPPAWGVTQWFAGDVTTGNDGTVVVAIAHPTDGLASTYGVRLDGAGATAQTRFAVPTSTLALRLELDRTNATLGTPIGFVLSARNLVTGKPIGDLAATVTVVHGSDRTPLTVTTGADGIARGSLVVPSLGTSLALATATLDGTNAVDATQIEMLPQTDAAVVGGVDSDVLIALDRPTYRIGDDAHVNASDAGAVGNALLTLEDAAGVETAVVGTNAAAAVGSFRMDAVPGDLSIGAVFVRDGAIEWNAVNVPIDGPGRPGHIAIALDKASYGPGTDAVLSLDPSDDATVVVRISRGSPSGSARFESAPDQLAIGLGATQNSAPTNPNWHPSVDSAGRSQSVDFERRGGGAPALTLAQSDSRAIYWQVLRHSTATLRVPMPAARGTYTLCVLRIGDDGRIAAATSNVVVR